MLTSLRTRLTLSHLAVIVVAMGLSGFLLLSLLERYFLQAMEQSLLAQARITAQALVPGTVTEIPEAESNSSAWNTLQNNAGRFSLQTDKVAPVAEADPWADVDLSYLADASLQLSAQLETRIRIVDVNGVVRVDSWQAGRELTIPADESPDLVADPVFVRALDGLEAVHVDPGGTGREAAMHLATALHVGEDLAGVVYLSQPLRDVTAVVHDLRTRWLISTVIALVFSGIIGLLLSGAITRPLRRLTAAAGSIAQGDLDPKVPVNGRDELGHLGRAFADMTTRLRAARQMQVDFVANVSHELRTPLTSIKGLVETLRDGAVEDLHVRDRFLQSVDAETERLIRLVNDLLTLSRADSEALDLRRQHVDPVRLVQTTLDRMSPLAENKPVTLLIEASGDCPSVLVDRDRIEQVLTNLLDNAIKYSPPAGKVRVSISPSTPRGPERAGWVEVVVRDEGLGIPADDLGHIGQRFYRADRARSRAEGGSGLGLAIARALVEAHGAGLWVESEEGAGTAVGFSLPCS